MTQKGNENKDRKRKLKRKRRKKAEKSDIKNILPGLHVKDYKTLFVTTGGTGG